MRVVLLGTGAALPREKRGSSAIAVQTEGDLLLFDCGEGTQMQLQKAQLRPGKLNRIFISHLHGDHFYGLIGLLTSLQLNGRSAPLSLYGPVGLEAYLAYMQDLSQFKFGYDITVHELRAEDDKVTWEFDDYAVTAMPLAHRLRVYGIRIEEKSKPGKFDAEKADRLGIPEGPLRGKLQQGETVVLPDGRKIGAEEVVGPPRAGTKIAICLDTSPCDTVLELAEAVDLLIHDATFDAGKEDLAESTGHSTVEQAARMALEAGTKKLVLTHISQRYDGSEDILLQQAQGVFPNSLIASDLMSIDIDSESL